jgi:acyl carrier protein
MDRAEALTKLQGVFDRVFVKKVTVRPELTSEDVEGWDSLKQVALTIAIEKAFGIKLDIEDLEDCANVGQMAERIAERATGGK